jgi:hypothetical protein
MSESRGQVLWSFGFAGLGVFKDIDLPPRKEGISRGGWQPTADVLLTILGSRQQLATHGNGFRLFPPSLRPGYLPLIAIGCARLAPQRLHAGRLS